MSGSLRRRVWREVRLEQDPDRTRIRILLDERPLRLPGGAVLRLGTPPLAEAVAREWSEAGGGAVGGVFGADGLTMTSLAGTQQERVAPNRPQVIETLLRHAASDLLCYRADQPSALATRQQAMWQPWLEWCAGRHGAALRVTDGVMPVAQPAAAVAALASALASQSDAVLTALGMLVPALGSLVLGLAVADGAIEAGKAARLARVDEDYQQESWGEDEQAAALRVASAREVAEAVRFMQLSADPC